MGMSASRRGDILDVRGAAYLLKARPNAVLHALECDEVPARRICGEWRFERAALEKWIAAGSSSSYAPLLSYRLTAFNITHRENVAHWQIY